jgi:hypothetical protein
MGSARAAYEMPRSENVREIVRGVRWSFGEYEELAGVYCGSASRGGNAFERADLQAAHCLTYRPADAAD